jgi:hypothetical protein
LWEQDSEGWDAIYAEMTYVSPKAEDRDNMEKLLYPNGLKPGTPLTAGGTIGIPWSAKPFQ